ncbi:MAG: germination protein YpeB [Clostridia bacterium]|nr:germination protein YpeB [Clostridia bacterium]
MSAERGGLNGGGFRLAGKWADWRNWAIVGLAAIALVLLGWGWQQSQAKSTLGYALEANYQRDFHNLINYVDQSQTLLGKGLASATPERRSLYLSQVWNRSLDAQSALSQLPIKELNLSATRKFLAQVGDYSYSLAEAGIRGQEVSSHQLDELARLQGEMKKLSQSLHAIDQDMMAKGYRWSSNVIPVSPLFGGRGRLAPMPPGQSVPAQARAGENVPNPPPSGSDESFQNIDQRMQELPSLVYDGPFSDHLERRTPLGLTGPEINQAQAEDAARRFLDVPNPASYRITEVRRVEGKIPAFAITFTDTARGETINVDVARKGGQVVWALSNRPAAKASIDAAEAQRRAQAFLAARGFKNMEPTFSMRQGNLQVISLVPRENGVVIYPDLIKVKVSLDDGRVVGFDAQGYLMAHHARKLPAPTLTAAEAQRRASDDLKPERVRLSLIPLESGKEVLAYEVRARKDADTYLVYINAQTGFEELILQVIPGPGGELAM